VEQEVLEAVRTWYHLREFLILAHKASDLVPEMDEADQQLFDKAGRWLAEEN
jgi:hypothetical protein